MAIGAARIMGFKLMTNFNRPYHAKSIDEFWKRWHISLSTWFKDYLYITLGGNRVTIPRWYLNLFIVFLVSGIWHGANWTFIIWGALHGSYLVISIITKKYREKTNQLLGLNKIPIISIFITFCLVAFGWIFFRANNVGDALYIATHLFSDLPNLFVKIMNHQPVLEQIGMSKGEIVLSLLLLLIMELVHFFQTKKNSTTSFCQLPVYVRWAFYYVVIITIICLGVFENRQFIYFQF